MICKNCEKEIDENSTICKYCGENQQKKLTLKIKNDYKENPLIGILAIIFSVFTAVFGLVFGIVGLNVYEDYFNRLHCKIGVYISITYLIIGAISAIIYCITGLVRPQ